MRKIGRYPAHIHCRMPLLLNIEHSDCVTGNYAIMECRHAFKYCYEVSRIRICDDAKDAKEIIMRFEELDFMKFGRQSLEEECNVEKYKMVLERCLDYLDEEDDFRGNIIETNS